MNEDTLKDLLTSLTHEDSPSPQHRARLEQDLRQSLAGQQTRQRVLRRTMMMRRIKQLSAAAAIAVVLVVGFTVINKTTAPAYGIVDTLALYQNVSTVHMKGVCIYDPSLDYPGQEPAVIPVEYWYDFVNGRSYVKDVGFGFGTHEYNYTVSETVNDGQYTMKVNHAKQTVAFEKNTPSEFGQQYLIRKNKLAMLQQIYSNLDQIDEYSIVGQEYIDDELYMIWEKSESRNIRLWISPESGEIARYRSWSRKQGDDWAMRYDMHTIERNVEIPEDTFAMIPPEQYTWVNTLETAEESLLIDNRVASTSDEGTLSLTTHIHCILNDGSLILGWSSEDTFSQDSQDALFDHLEFGGPLPKLPSEIYAVKPTNYSRDFVGEYPGYHLAYTKKLGKFYEWSIYIPDTPSTEPYIRGYHLMIQDNSNNGSLGLAINPAIIIESREEFDLFVRGAMAEFSDDNTAPDYITHDSVVQLIEQIRGSTE